MASNTPQLARSVPAQASTADANADRRNETWSSRSPASEEAALDEILADSFPASDPPPWTLGVYRDAMV